MTVSNEDVALLPPDNKIDIFDLFTRFLRRLPIFLVVAAIVMAAVAAYTLTRVPTYTAVASVVIEPRNTEVVAGQPVVSDLPTDSPAIDTEALILNSEELAQRVVRRLNLQNDPEFNPDASEGMAPIKAGLRPADQEEAVKRAARAVQGATEVKRSGLTYVIDVHFTSLDPMKAATIANAQVEEYIASQIDTSIGATRDASLWLESRLQALQEEVQRNEAALQQFLIANNLMSASGATMAEQEVSTLNQQIAVAAADLAEKRARLSAAQQQMAQGGGGSDVAAVQESENVQSLRQQQAEYAVALAELETRYGPLHPDVQKAKQQLQSVDQELQTETQRVLSALAAEVRVAEQRHASLAASRARAQGALGANNRSVVGLNELQRKVDASRAVYETFLSRAKETAAQEGLQRPDARISARARPPGSPSNPNVPLNLALGFVAAMVMGAGAVVLMETLDSGIRSSADVRSRLRIPMLGTVPLLTKMSADRMHRLVVDKPFSSFAEAFRSLKRSIWAATGDVPSRAIAFTSALPSEGKTMTALSFGRTVARGGARTLVIDGDLRRRSLTAAFNCDVKAGLVEVLQGSVPFDQAIVQDELSGAYLLLLADATPPETDLFDGSAWPGLLSMLKERGFDVIVIDTAPVLGIADARGICLHADAVVMIVRWEKTPKDAARTAVDMLKVAGANVVGACLTMVDQSKRAQMAYGEPEKYAAAFRQYYTE